jgi:hypothetical protein
MAIALLLTASQAVAARRDLSDVLEGPGWQFAGDIILEMGEPVFGGAALADECRRLGYFYEAECQKARRAVSWDTPSFSPSILSDMAILPLL